MEVPYIVQGLLEELRPLLQRAIVQLDAPVSLIIQEAGQGHPVVCHVACHGEESQDELPVCLLGTAFSRFRALATQSRHVSQQWAPGMALL